MKWTTVALAFVCVEFAACGGGGGGGSSSVPVPVSTATTASSLVTIPAGANVQSVPPVNGIAAKMYIPGPSETNSLTAAYAAALSGTSTTPQGVPALTIGTPLEYIVFTPTVSGSYATYPGFVFTAASGFPAYGIGAFYHMAMYTNAATTKGYVDLGFPTSVVTNANSTTVAFGSTPGFTPPSSSSMQRVASATPAPAPTFGTSAGYNYVFVLYASTVSPTPSPTPTPAPTPTPVIAASPGSMTFANVGMSYAQSLKVSYPGETGAITVASNNTHIVSVSGSGNAPSATFTVTPLAVGNTTLTVSSGSATATVDVSVSIPGGLTASPSPMTFANVGASFEQTLNIAYPNDVGDTVTVSTSSTACATVNGNASATGTIASIPVPFTIVPTGQANCTLTIAAGNGASATDAVTVNVPVDLSTSPSSSIALYGTTAPVFDQTLIVQYPAYTGSVTVTSSNASVATVSTTASALTGSASAAGTLPGPSTFTIVPVGVGSCTLTALAGNGQSLTLTVTVNSTGITGQ
jgi:hypothetical protein